MKYHRNLLLAVVAALQTIFAENRFADIVIEKTFKANKQWGARDRRFIAEAVYEIVRWWRLLSEAAGTRGSLDAESLKQVVAAWLVSTGKPLPQWEDFQTVDEAVVKKRLKKLAETRALRHSIPDWLDELGDRELGGRWEKELTALNQTAPLVVRTNTLRTARGKLRRVFEREQIAVMENDISGEVLIVPGKENVFRLPEFKKGHFEVQDLSSQRVAPFTGAAPGMWVVDACAGAGGKTLHLAALMQNKGRIVAMDTLGWKLNELKRRAKRAGAHLIETRTIDSTKQIKRLQGKADIVLLDVPCSGLGVLRRNPDAKWKLDEERIAELRKTQAEILASYSSMVKPGGVLVYATCSILPSENERQAEAFLENNEEQFELAEQQHLWPSETGYDGFYLAKMKRKK